MNLAAEEEEEAEGVEDGSSAGDPVGYRVDMGLAGLGKDLRLAC